MRVYAINNVINSGEADKLKSSVKDGIDKIEISSPGGNLMEALTMFGDIGKTDLEVEITGVAASAAHMLSLAGKKLPKIVDYGAVLIHRPRFGNDTKGKDNFQKATLNTLFNSAVTAMSKKSGMDRKRLEALMNANDGEGTWLTAEELVNAGMASEIIETQEADKGAKMAALIEGVKMELKFTNKPKKKMTEAQMHFGVESEEAVMSAIKGLEEKNAELTAANLSMSAEIAQAKKKSEEIAKKGIESKVDMAIEKGKIQKEAREEWVELGMTNEALMTTTLEGLSVNMIAPEVEQPNPNKELKKESVESLAMKYEDLDREGKADEATTEMKAAFKEFYSL